MSKHSISAVQLVYAIVLCVALQTNTSAQSNDPPRNFSRDQQESTLPGFGRDRVVIPYTDEDLRRAQGLMERYDKNRNKLLDTEEMKEGQWRFGKPLDYDFNHDGMISAVEMAQRLAARSNGEEPAAIPPYYSVTKQMRAEAMPVVIDDRQERRRRWSEDLRRSRELAFDMISRYDRDQDSQLNVLERQDLGIDVLQADENADDLLSANELAAWLDKQIGEQLGDLTDVLPDWFFERDGNADGQISMEEFADDWSADLVQQFDSIDANGDGFVTSYELGQARSVTGGEYKTELAEVIKPRVASKSRLVIEDDLPIQELSVKITISHSYVEQLTAYLLSPDGAKIVLFDNVGGSGDHFQGTIFRDSAGGELRRAQAPFRDEYKPMGKERGETGLSDLHGKSAKGEWTLVIDGARNQRYGILHSWSLIIKPQTKSETKKDS